jgi:hypothetical protein
MFWDGVPSRTSGRARIGEQSEEEPDYNISRRCVLYCNSLLPLNEKRGAIVHNTFHKNIGRLPIFVFGGSPFSEKLELVENTIDTVWKIFLPELIIKFTVLF